MGAGVRSDRTAPIHSGMETDMFPCVPCFIRTGALAHWRSGAVARSKARSTDASTSSARCMAASNSTCCASQLIPSDEAHEIQISVEIKTWRPCNRPFSHSCAAFHRRFRRLNRAASTSVHCLVFRSGFSLEKMFSHCLKSQA